MRLHNSTIRRLAIAPLVVALAACSGTGGLGNVLGSVLGGGSNNELSGTVQSVNPRNAQIGVRQQNGQTVYVSYDNNTRVIYQNQQYSPNNLEQGDQITVAIQDNGNGGYYASTVQVNQSVRGGSTQPGQGSAQSFQGTIRQVDRSNGYFTLDDGNVGRITVYLSNNLSRADLDRYNNLRNGDVVRIYGYRTSSSQVQLQSFY